MTRTRRRFLRSGVVVAASFACVSTAPAGDVPPASATYEVRQEFTVRLPEGAHEVRFWGTMPQEGPAQTVEDLRIEAPVPHRVEKDSEGDRVFYLEVKDPESRELSIVETFRVTRTEVRTGATPEASVPLTDEDRAKLARFLEPNANVAITDAIRAKAKEVVAGERNPVAAAKRIYDHVLADVDYWVKDPEHRKASPVGSSDYCMTSGTGNCTDIHSLFVAMARAEGLPTRMVYGVLMKKELDGRDVDASYHCWVEFHAGRLGWVPLDVAVADIYAGGFELNDANGEKVRRTTPDGYAGPDPEKVKFYFGNLEDRRVAMSSGRDLDLAPKQAGGKVNHLPKAYVEVDGKPAGEGELWTRKLTYREVR